MPAGEKMFSRIRIKYASKFGKLEHKFGRLIAIPILVSIFYNIYIQEHVSAAISVLIFICWVIYLLSHTLEKKFYGHYGPRG